MNHTTPRNIVIIKVLILLLITNINTVLGQCPVTASVNQSTINCGQSVNLSASGTPGFYIFTQNFNAGCPGSNWAASTSADCSNPCGNGPSGSTDPYLWMSSESTAPRNVTTNNYDVSTGGTICFDMRYSAEEPTEGCAATALTCDCEGPDQSNEGVSLQYSTDGGATWIEISYWDPNGGQDPTLINWNRRCVTIPAGAMTTSTMFRWYQEFSSDANSDHWGLDNITIATNNPNFLFDWTHDGLAAAATSTTPAVTPTSNTVYTVNYSDGTTTCSSTVAVTVINPTVNATAASASVCQGSSTQLTANSSLIATPPSSCGINTYGGCPPNSQAGEPQIGTGTTVASYNSGSDYVYGDFGSTGGVRTQIIYRASELTAQGFSAGQITNMQLDVGAIQTNGGSASSVTLNAFTIQIGCTSTSAFASSSAWITTGFTTVFPSTAVTVVPGWNTYNFPNSYNWDGVSNIVVQICWYNGSSGGNACAKTRTQAAGFNSMLASSVNASGAAMNCNTHTSFQTLYTIRPNTRFGTCVPRNITLNYNWSPAGSLSNPAVYNPVATPAATTTYTVTVAENGAPAACAATSTVTVSVITTNMTAVNGSRCGTGTVVLSTTGCTGTVNWYAASSGGASLGTGASFTTPSISSTTTYYASCTASGCVFPRIPVIATVNPVPSSAFTISPTTVCAGVNTTITYTGPVVAGQTYAWNFAGGTVVSGSGQGPYVVNWPNPAGGTYNVTLTVTSAAGCASALTTQTATTTPGPALTITPNAPSYCAPGSVNLAGNVVLNPTTYNTSGTNATDFVAPDAGVASTWNGSTGTFSTSPINIAGLNPSAWNINSICLNINADKDQEVIVYLRNPCGGLIRLIRNNGGTASTGFNTTCFSPSASTDISAGAAPFNGTFIPEQGAAAWAAFLACGTPNGTWQLLVGDAATSSPVAGLLTAVTLTNWTISFTSSNYVTNYSWSPATNLTSTNTASTTASPSVTTTYSLTVTDALGCPATTPVTVTVNTPAAAPTAGNNGPVCVGAPLNLTSNTVAGATYSWTGPNSFTSSSEDPTVNLNATTAMAGTYSVTATVAGCTSLIGTTTVVVNPVPSAPVPTNNGPVCAGTALNLTSNTIAGATYSWTGPNAFVSSLEDPSVSASATTAMSGTYSVTATVAGCTSIAGTTTVTVNPIPSAPVPSNNGPVCAGAALNLTSNTIAGATYSWTGPNAFTSSLEDPSVSASATTATSGTYSVTATVAGCTSIAGTTTVTVNPIPSAPVPSNNGPVCAGAALNLTSNTIASATYSWTGPNAFVSSLEDPSVSASATTAMSGTYSVTATVAGCTSIAGTTTVTVNPIPSAPIPGNNGPVCAGAALNLTSNTIAGATYSWTGPNAFTSSLEDPSVSVSATTATSGTYSVTVTVAGCTSIAGTTTVTVNPIPSAPVPSNNGPVCAGVALNLTSNTIAGATYSWTGPNAFVSSLEDPSVSASATTAMAGTYSVTATVAGCTSIAGTTTVTVNPIPSAPVPNNNGPVCAGAALNLTSNTIAGATYSWTGPNAFTSSLEDPFVSASATTAMSGTYSVTATVAGCTSSAGTTTVTVNPIPSAPVPSNNGPVCAGAALNLTSNTIAGATYSWTGPNAFTSSLEDPSVSASATTAMSGTYSVTATVAGCTSIAGTTTVTVNPVPSAPIPGNNGPVCVGAALSLTSNTIAGATYSWTGPNAFISSLEDPSVSASSTTAMSGTYSVTATVAGCTSIAGTTTVTVNPIPSAPIPNNNGPVCAGAALNLTSNTIAGATYSWTGPNAFVSSLEDPSVSASATTAMAGTYSVTATVAGCTSIAGTTTVTVNPPVTPIAGSNSPVCVGSSLTLNTAAVTGATYNWTGPNAFVSTLQNPVVNASATPVMAGTYSLTITVSGCTSEISTTSVTVNPLPNSNAGADKTLSCASPSVTLDGTSTTPGAGFSWGGPGGFASSSATPSTAVAGTYTLTVTVNGCSSTDQMIVNAAAGAPNANAGTPQTITCTTTTTSLNGSSSTAGVTYSWAGPGIVSGGTTPAPTVNAAGSYTLTVTDPGNGCSASNQVAVTANTTPPNSNAGTVQTINCTSSTVTLNGSSSTAGSTFNWSGPGIVSGGTTATPTVNAAGTYTLTVTDPSNGCTNGSLVVVNSNTTAPNSNAGTAQTINCTNASVALNGSSTTSGAAFNWAGPGIVSGGTSATPTVNAAGTYTLTVTDPANGCTAPSTVVVNSNTTAPNANAGTAQILSCTASSVTLNGSSTTSGATFSWSGPAIVSGGTTSSPSVNTAGTYTLTITDPSNGCSSTSTVVVNSNTTAPNSNAGSAQTLTCTASSALLNGSSTTAGATYSWNGPGIVSGGTTASPTVNAAGTYTLTVTDPSNGCTTPSTVVVNSNNASPDANAGSTQTMTCSSPTVNLNGSSSTSGATFSWSGPGIVSGGTTATPSVNAPGTYALTVTDPSNGCTATSSVVVNANSSAPNANAGSTQTLTCTTSSVVLNGSSTTTGATYNWSGAGIVSGGNTATPSVNAAGTYTLTVTDPSNGCASPATVVINSNTTTPNSNAGAAQTLTCTATTVTLNGSSTTTGAAFNWSGPGILSGGNTSSATVNAAGTYTLTVTDPANGCTGTSMVAVNNSAGVPNSNAGTTQTLSCTTTSVVLNGSSTTAGATYSWSGPGIVSGGTTSSPTVNAAGTYTLTVTDPSNGCTTPSTVAVSADTNIPNSNAGTSQTIDCSSSNATLNGSSTTTGASFSWSGPGIVSGGNTATPTVNAAGTYTLTVTDPANGCTAPSTVVVNSNTTTPNSNAGAAQTISCSATSVTLNGSSTTTGAMYSWSGPGVVSGGNTATPTVNAAGTYTVIVTDPSNGCSSTSTVAVNSNTSTPNSNAGTAQTLTCTSTSVTLNGSSSTSGAAFSWSGPGIVSGGTTSTPTVNAAGTYTLTVADPSNGCASTSTVAVNAAAGVPNANAGTAQTITCSTTSATLNGSSTTPGATYNWSGPGIVSGGTTATPTVNTAGTYTLTVTDPSNGCTAPSTVVVNSNISTPNSNAGSPQTLTCTATSVTLNGSSTTSGAAFSWTGPGIVSGGNTAAPTVNTAGTYTLTVTDPANGCTAPSTVSVSAGAGTPNANAGSTQSINCSVASVSLNGSSTTTGATYSWSGPGIVSGGTTPTPTVNAAGTYTLTVTDPSNGCTAPSTVVVNSNTTTPNSNAGSAQTLTCTATSVTLNGSSTTTGATFSWSGAGIVSGGSTSTPTVNTAGTYTLTVTDPSNGCSATSTASVNTAAGVPNSNAGTAQTLTCTATSVTLNGSSTTSGVTYNWSGSGIISGGTTSSPVVNTAGTYTLTVTNPSNGCNAASTVVVNNSTAAPNANAGSNQTMACSAATTSLNGTSTTSGAAFNWSGPGIVSGGNTNNATVNAIGTYTLTVTDPSNGCTSTSTVTVSPATPITVNAGSDATVTLGSSAALEASGAASYSWSPSAGLSCTNCPNPIVTPTETTTYCVTGTDGSCTDNDCVTIEVKVPCVTNKDLGVPNAFSPNNDGNNDEFCLQGWSECMKGFNIIIFDRWGEKVFESSESNFCWNGTFRGRTLDPAVFVYFINATFTTGESTTKKGNISIIR
jgi:gliding motility-associated-like protein